ncbi:hypothetical protein ITJ38_15530 [Agreia pratensis]|uniref:hypothetical protein n=1 Tax=Agreia pratensis TaxID=150121 RepID=UPI00188CD582|nr:hypothetical protein [Agreia pratensis]MBF4635821.1 hypothetical protein [Agreia pratensis]
MILNRVLRIGVLFTALAAIVVLLFAAGGDAGLGVDTLIPEIAVLGAVGGLISSVRYATVRLAVGQGNPAATSFDAATTTWGDLRGMIADAGWAVLLGTAGWIVACIVRATQLQPGQQLGGEALAFFMFGSMWLMGFLATVVAAFLVWMPLAVFVSALAEKRKRRKTRGSWLALAWCLVGVDLLVLLMVAEAAFVPHGADGQAHPQTLWQTMLFVVVSVVLIVLSIGWVVMSIGSWNPHPRRRRSARSLESNASKGGRR